MSFQISVHALSDAILSLYNNTDYPELMTKEARPYACLCIETENGIICIPFRSQVRHQNAFLFKTSNRSKENRSGLDYSKLLILTNPDDLIAPITVDQDEYNEVRRNSDKIGRQVQKYIQDYKNHITGAKPLDKAMFNRRYCYSTLKYFHPQLNLPLGGSDETEMKLLQADKSAKASEVRYTAQEVFTRAGKQIHK